MNLLLLTKFYPYGTGEAFLENEIEILSEYYDKILIIACEVSEEIAKSKRQLPRNVEAHYVPAAPKYKNLLFGLKNIFSKENDFKEENKKAHGLMQKFFLYYFEEKSQRIFNHIIRNNMIYDIVNKDYILYSYWLFITARVGILIKHFHKPIYSFSRTHRYDLYEEENNIKYLPYRKLFLKEYTNIFPCSANGSLYLKTKYKKLANNIKTSYLGTIDHGINPIGSDSIFHLVSCSRVEPVKRINKIVEVLEVLDKKKLQIEWTHIGDGSDLHKIKKHVRKKIKNIKCIFKGNIQNSEIIKLYQEKHFDLFINLSSNEGIPVSIMEALSFGIPVIATDVGGTSEIVKNNITGILIKKEFDIIDLSELIEKFIQKDFVALKKSCRNFWNKNFRADIEFVKLHNFIKNEITFKSSTFPNLTGKF